MYTHKSPVLHGFVVTKFCKNVIKSCHTLPGKGIPDPVGNMNLVNFIERSFGGAVTGLVIADGHACDLVELAG